ncbi:MAG: hypothetical protein ACI9QD_000309 [Thermoproteota archaeon]|jgi:hypothetical protein
MKHLIVFILLTNTAFCYTPSIESLLRNGVNKDVGNTTVVAKLHISKAIEEKVKTSEKSLTDDTDLKKDTEFISMKSKYVFFKEDNQSLMTELKFSKSYSYIDIKEKTFEENLNVEYFEQRNILYTKGVFYSVLKCLLLNDSKLITDIIIKLDEAMGNNNSLIDKEKVSLLIKYKEYLTLIKEDKDLVNSIENPLTPEDEELRTEIKVMLKKPFYNKGEGVELVRKDNKFLWQVTKNNFRAEIDNKTREIRYLSFKVGNDYFDFHFKDYIIANGTHSFPSIFKINYLGEKYSVTLDKLSHFVEEKTKYIKRQKIYNEKIIENNKELELLIKPPFVL